MRFRDVRMSLEQRFEQIHGIVRASCVEGRDRWREQGVDIPGGSSGCGGAGDGLGGAAAKKPRERLEHLKRVTRASRPALADREHERFLRLPCVGVLAIRIIGEVRPAKRVMHQRSIGPRRVVTHQMVPAAGECPYRLL